MFTIDSAGFLYADLSDWWMNNRVGCAFDTNIVTTLNLRSDVTMVQLIFFGYSIDIKKMV